MIIEIDKKYLIGIVFVMLIITGAFFVVSYGGNDPSYAGHNLGEIDFSELKNFCIFSPIKSNCPPGWSLNSNFFGRTVRITPGGQDLGKMAGSNFADSKTGYGFSSEWHQVHKDATNWPPYVNVIVCCKD